MESLFARYAKEVFGYEVIEYPGKGFAAFKLTPPVCSIEDFYAVPEMRGIGWANGTLLQDVINRAKEAGCTTLQSRVNVNQGYAEGTLRGQLRDGFKLAVAQNGAIILLKSIGGENG